MAGGWRIPVPFVPLEGSRGPLLGLGLWVWEAQLPRPSVDLQHGCSAWVAGCFPNRVSSSHPGLKMTGGRLRKNRPAHLPIAALESASLRKSQGGIQLSGLHLVVTA